MKQQIKTTEAIFPMPVLLISKFNEDGTADVMNAAWGTMLDRDKVVHGQDRVKSLLIEDAVLVECAASDRAWACGIRLNNLKRFDASNWTGENILGFALMEVRDGLKKQQS